MIKQVFAYETEDGARFLELEDAVTHDRVSALFTFIEKKGYLDDGEEVAQFINKNWAGLAEIMEAKREIAEAVGQGAATQNPSAPGGTVESAGEGEGDRPSHRPNPVTNLLSSPPAGLARADSLRGADTIYNVEGAAIPERKPEIGESSDGLGNDEGGRSPLDG